MTQRGQLCEDCKGQGESLNASVAEDKDGPISHQDQLVEKTGKVLIESTVGKGAAKKPLKRLNLEQLGVKFKPEDVKSPGIA